MIWSKAIISRLTEGVGLNSGRNVMVCARIFSRPAVPVPCASHPKFLKGTVGSFISPFAGTFDAAAVAFCLLCWRRICICRRRCCMRCSAAPASGPVVLAAGSPTVKLQPPFCTVPDGVLLDTWPNGARGCCCGCGFPWYPNPWNIFPTFFTHFPPPTPLWVELNKVQKLYNKVQKL